MQAKQTNQDIDGNIVCTTCHKDYLRIIKVHDEEWSNMDKRKLIS